LTLAVAVEQTKFVAAPVVKALLLNFLNVEQHLEKLYGHAKKDLGRRLKTWANV